MTGGVKRKLRLNDLAVLSIKRQVVGSLDYEKRDGYFC